MNWPTLRSAGTRYFFLSIVAMSLFSTFSQMTYAPESVHTYKEWMAYRDAVGVLLTDTVCLSLALLYVMLVEGVY